MPDDTVRMLEAIAEMLTTTRMVKHSVSDALRIAIDFCEREMSEHIELMTKFYLIQEMRTKVILSKVVRDQARINAKKYSSSLKAYIEAVTTLFMRALMARYWRQSTKTYEQLKSEYPDFVYRKAADPVSIMPLRKAKPYTRTKLYKREEIAMRYHKYIDEFVAYMDTVCEGGLKTLLNKNVVVAIHAHSIAGNVGHPRPEDVAIEANPGRDHLVRIWKRGRGYNLTILAHGPQAGEGAPELEIGTVYRLNDIYRNINWNNLVTS